MKARDIQIGGTYLAKVGGRIVPVRITGTFGWTAGKTFRDGYLATNQATGRHLRIKTAQRLRGRAED